MNAICLSSPIPMIRANTGLRAAKRAALLDATEVEPVKVRAMVGHSRRAGAAKIVGRGARTLKQYKVASIMRNEKSE